MTSKRTSNLRELFNSNTLVATYNADPFAIEYEEMLDEVLNTMDEYAEVYTKDDEDFDIMASQLDGNVNTYSEIYRSNGTMVGVLVEYTNNL